MSVIDSKWVIESCPYCVSFRDLLQGDLKVAESSIGSLRSLIIPSGSQIEAHCSIESPTRSVLVRSAPDFKRRSIM